MSWNEVVYRVNGQLEKAKEFRYFALLATFVFFLDFCLVVFQGSHISALSFEAIKGGYTLGHALLFFALFAFFMSFVVPLVQYFLRFVSFLVPYKVLSFFSDDQWRDIDPKDYFLLSELERYAIKNENSIAYEYYKSLEAAKEKEYQLNYFCLSLTLSVSLNCYAYFENKNALFSWFVSFFYDGKLSFLASLVSLSLWLLVLFSIYLGVVRAGGFLLSVSDRIYFPNNEFRNS